MFGCGAFERTATITTASQIFAVPDIVTPATSIATRQQQHSNTATATEIATRLVLAISIRVWA